MSLSKRDRKVIWHPYTQMMDAKPPIAIVKGEGAYLYDENEELYIDAISSWWVNLHGHSHPYITQKVSEQLQKLEHVIFAGFTHEPAIQLAEELLKVLPTNQSRIFYSDNGSTAVEVALKMSLQYWQNKGIKKSKIIAFNNAYHGDTFGAMSVSSRTAFTDPFRDLLFEVLFIEPPVPGNEEISLNQLKELIEEEGENIASFIFEPLVMGAAGMLMYEGEGLDELIALCRKRNILIIADEVMTGFGRTGNLFAVDYLSQKPDVICLSKGLTGGTMALGVTSCTEDIYNAFLSDDKSKTFFHGHSFTANPLACAAAIASLELLMEESCQEAIGDIFESHKKFSQDIDDFPAVKEIRITGTIMAIELKTGEKGGYFSSVRDFIYDYFIKKGIILRPLGNVLYILPPYCISKDDLQYIYKTIVEFLTFLKQDH
jgi:adenosylmethionine---8-amino-7-oxononanoate aminotransferase